MKLEDDDRDMDRKMKLKAKNLKRPITSLKPDKIALKIKQEVDNSMETEVGGSNIVLNSTAEFCRTLGDIPTYGQAGNRDENTQEFMVTVKSKE